jgi:hypothetical protein
MNLTCFVYCTANKYSLCNTHWPLPNVSVHYSANPDLIVMAEYMYCGMFAQSKNCGTREKAIARWRLCNTQQCSNCWKRCFLCDSWWDYIMRTSCHYGTWPCGGGFEYLHHILRVIGSDEKGSLKSETVKCGHKSQGTRTRERLHWRGPAVCTKDRSVLLSERAPQKKTRL